MAKDFNPGEFRHKIDFLKRDAEQDGYGDPVDTWKIFKPARASKEPLLGNEFFASQTTDNKIEVKFKTRYIKGITSEMRIRHGDEVYEIIGPPIDVKSMHKELICYCRLVK